METWGDIEKEKSSDQLSLSDQIRKEGREEKKEEGKRGKEEREGGRKKLGSKEVWLSLVELEKKKCSGTLLHEDSIGCNMWLE